MQRTPDAEFHGSHIHAMIRAFGTERPGRHLRQCTLCRGSVDTSQDQSARRCTQCPEFVLCIKCFEVDEYPFPSPQVVVRNPALLRSDDTICVRTRPRGSAYVLCPIPAGELIEVVAYATTKDGTDDVYFRQQTGGWIRSVHVVCVLPSERSIARLSKVHFDYHYDGQTVPFTAGLCLQFIEETIDMIQDSPDFGAIMGYLTLLPIHIALFGHPAVASTRDPLTGFTQYHCTCIAGYLLQLLSNTAAQVEEHLSMPPRQRSMDASIHYQVKMCARILVILSKLRHESIAAASVDLGTPHHAAHVVCLAAGVLQRVLSTTATAATSVEPMSLTDERDVPRTANPRNETCGSTPTSRQDVWGTWHGDNTLGISGIRGIAWYSIELAAQLVMGSSRSWLLLHHDAHAAPKSHPTAVTVAPEVREMAAVLLATITCAEQFPEALAIHVCTALLHALQDAEEQHCHTASIADLQWEIYNMDVVEIAMRVVKEVRDESSVLAALNLLRCIVDKNPRMIQLLASVVIGPLLQFLRLSSRPAEISAAFDVCSAFAYNAPGRGDRPPNHHTPDKVDHGFLLPMCTAKLYPQATPFQPMHLYQHQSTRHVIAVCAHCADHHPPQGFARAVHHISGGPADAASNGLRHATILDDAIPQHKYFSCQCEACGVSEEPAPVLVVPPVPMTLAQKLLGMGRILNITAQRIRTHGTAVLNAAGRLSMLLCCNEEVAVAMFCSLVSQPIVLFADGVLAVAACAQFDQVRYLMTLYQNAEITHYLQNQASFVATAAAALSNEEGSCTTPQQHGRKEPLPSTDDSSDVGLTPSPGTSEPQFQRSKLADDGEEKVAQPVRLFSST
jgi:hypothetical protein